MEKCLFWPFSKPLLPTNTFVKLPVEQVSDTRNRYAEQKRDVDNRPEPDFDNDAVNYPRFLIIEKYSNRFPC
jgi:hypothetical protein